MNVAGKVRRGPQPRKRPALGFHGEIVDLALRCTACGATQTEPAAADASVRATIAGVTCLFCGRCDSMRLGSS